jgi:DNA-binding MarR family transcriptional regulator
MARSGDGAAAATGAAPGGAGGEAGATGAAPEGASCRQALADDLGWTLGVTFRTYVTAAGAVFADLPGGPRGYQVLAAAAHGAVNSQLALAEQLGVDRTVMTYLLDDLEAAGLIERQADPADRRARRIVATGGGRHRLESLERRLRDAESHVLAPLDLAAQASFRAHLRAIAAGVGAAGTVAAAAGTAATGGDPCDVITAENPFPL